MLRTSLSHFNLLLQHSAEKGVLLLLAAISALMLANSSYLINYNAFLAEEFAISLGSSAFNMTLQAWINDFLMAIFFLLVGMEIKREMIEGHLASRRQKLLPFISAIFGVLFPVLIYCCFNYADEKALKGWAVPSATDIAFALGMLSLFGRSIPMSLKVFLTALAIIDDLIAVVIIALFYSHNIEPSFLIYIAFICCLLYLLNKADMANISLYCILGVVMWYCFLKSGIHPTISGVLLGLMIPLYNKNGGSILKDMERMLHNAVTHVILPLFAFANSGLNISGITITTLQNTVTLGIIMGLFFGKQIGVFVSSAMLIKLKICEMPKGANYLEIYGVAALCGIGFTMSLFIGILAFDSKGLSFIQLGVFTGSILCSIYGAVVLRVAGVLKKV